MTTTIKYSDLVESLAAALQYISYYHPADYIAHLARVHEQERSAPQRTCGAMATIGLT
jgi:fumarate hydratase, class I